MPAIDTATGATLLINVTTDGKRINRDANTVAIDCSVSWDPDRRKWIATAPDSGCYFYADTRTAAVLGVFALALTGSVSGVDGLQRRTNRINASHTGRRVVVITHAADLCGCGGAHVAGDVCVEP